MYLNESIVEGVLAKQPRLFLTKSGRSITQFNLENITHFTKSDGEDVEEVNWILCEAAGDVAKEITNETKENDAIQVYGRIKHHKTKEMLMISVDGWKKIRKLTK